MKTGMYPGDILQIHRDTCTCTLLLITGPRCRGRWTSKRDHQHLRASMFPSEVQETGKMSPSDRWDTENHCCSIVETLLNFWGKIISLQMTSDTHHVNTPLISHRSFRRLMWLSFWCCWATPCSHEILSCTSRSDSRSPASCGRFPQPCAENGTHHVIPY